jgi:hypothetical protein
MKYNEYQNIAIIGDRVVDTARWIGVHPSLMATASIPMIETIMPLSRQVECTACVLGRKRSAFFGVARKMGISKVILEHNDSVEINPSDSRGAILEMGFDVEIVDFSGDVENGIRDTCRVLGKEKRVQKIILQYQKSLKRAHELASWKADCRVLVLLGIINSATGEEFLLAEDSGALDSEIFEKMGCMNVSPMVGTPIEYSQSESIRLVRDLVGLEEAAPDLIALTCSPVPGLKAIGEYIKKAGTVSNVPALKNHAILALPHCCETEPIQLPMVIEAWVDALSRVSF